MLGFTRLQSQNGQMIPLVAIVIGLVLGFAAIAVNMGYIRVNEVELQASADAAAHAGASNLCGTKACWDSVESAMQMTAEYQVLNMTLPEDEVDDVYPEIGDSLGREVGELPEPTEIEPGAYEFLGATITLERGRWVMDENGQYQGFQSLEDQALPAALKGIPPFLAANAVRVKMERRKPTLMSSVFGGEEHIDVSEAVAIVDRPQEVCAAPFAIPACALLNDFGELDTVGICRSERLFTRIDQFCPNGNCGGAAGDTAVNTSRHIPKFPSDSCGADPRQEYVNRDVYKSEDVQIATEIQPLVPGGDTIASASEPLCATYHGQPRDAGTLEQMLAWGWQNGAFDRPSKHFGIIGLPESLSKPETLELDIEDILNDPSGAGCRKMRIGEAFLPLREGFTDARFEDYVWNMITDERPDEDHSKVMPIAQSELGSIERSVHLFQVTDSSAQDLSDPAFARQGICPSRWIQPDAARARVITTMGGPSAVQVPFKLKSGVSDETNVWKVKVPIVAATNIPNGDSCEPGQPCACAGDNRFWHMNPDARLEIIGFVDVYVSDVSIGKDSQTFAEASGNSSLDIQWGFETESGSRRCNAVRAKIACDSSFFAGATEAGTKPVPSLVELPAEVNLLAGLGDR